MSANWQPGDPLYKVGYSPPILELKSDGPSPEQFTALASWPEPRPQHDLDELDNYCVSIRELGGEA